MCDLISWGVMERNVIVGEHTFKRGDLVYLTDDMVEAYLSAQTGPLRPFSDFVGHSGIAEVLGISGDSFNHHEGLMGVPAKIGEDYNNGKMRKIAAASGIPDPPRTLTKLRGKCYARKPALLEYPQSSKITGKAWKHAFDICDKWAGERRTPEALEAVKVLKGIVAGKRHRGPREIGAFVTTLLLWSSMPELEHEFSVLHEHMEKALDREIAESQA